MPLKADYDLENWCKARRAGRSLATVGMPVRLCELALNVCRITAAQLRANENPAKGLRFSFDGYVHANSAMWAVGW